MTALKTLPRMALAMAVAAPVVACGPRHDAGASKPAASTPSGPHAAAAGTHTWQDPTWHIAIDVPAGWTVHRDFTSSYLANGAWKTFAGPGSQGTPVVALMVPGSNRITDAEIRIGVSTDRAEVQRCTQPPDAVRPGSTRRETIGGIGFATYAAGDAAMSHYLDVHSYRAVYGGACYAIDLLVYGANPKVFDPPAKVPFSREEAFARMRAVLASFRFTN